MVMLCHADRHPINNPTVVVQGIAINTHRRAQSSLGALPTQLV